MEAGKILNDELQIVFNYLKILYFLDSGKLGQVFEDAIKSMIDEDSRGRE